jgi:hypothetical protein
MTTTEAMSTERLDRYILEAAKAAGYEEGFGVRGCDLKNGEYGAAYTRQSLREQAENDRLAEYLLTCAKMAKQIRVVIPREYVLYDNVTSEHLGRPKMIYLRGNLIAQRLIIVVILPTIGRLSDDDHHR